MNEQENINLVRQSYANFLQGNIEAVIKMCADDIEWETPGPSDIPRFPLGINHSILFLI